MHSSAVIYCTKFYLSLARYHSFELKCSQSPCIFNSVPALTAIKPAPNERKKRKNECASSNIRLLLLAEKQRI